MPPKSTNNCDAGRALLSFAASNLMELFKKHIKEVSSVLPKEKESKRSNMIPYIIRFEHSGQTLIDLSLRLSYIITVRSVDAMNAQLTLVKEYFDSYLEECDTIKSQFEDALDSKSPLADKLNELEQKIYEIFQHIDGGISKIAKLIDMESFQAPPYYMRMSPKEKRKALKKTVGYAD